MNYEVKPLSVRPKFLPQGRDEAVAFKPRPELQSGHQDQLCLEALTY